MDSSRRCHGDLSNKRSSLRTAYHSINFVIEKEGVPQLNQTHSKHFPMKVKNDASIFFF
jgi:hypothetical protein